MVSSPKHKPKHPTHPRQHAHHPHPALPPLPPAPAHLSPGAIVPFGKFKERGIQIFSAGPGGEEVDGLGIPTVELRVRHETDECKTEAGRKGKGRGVGRGVGVDIEVEGEDVREGEGVEIEVIDEKNEQVKEPLKKGAEQRLQRQLLFAKKTWYDQWAEGEDLRTTTTYNPNTSPVDRIHLAATDFRTGRVWPPAYTRLGYLWDQFRLFVGLLGETPIWTRTDIPQPSDDPADDSDDPGPSSSNTKPPRADIDLSSDFSDSEDPPPPSVRTSTSPPAPRPFKRIPPRTPYSLYNATPVPISSDAGVRRLLARAARRREGKLLAFLADPEGRVGVFLSSYLREEGLIWFVSSSPSLPLSSPPSPLLLSNLY
ncbi:hypothetical protein B0H34DRAFT_690801 [Crassisporium funariophilum]|nr:hypothetical protein B0H34DRAFT_690801 [Crassisporium funariophilum]